MDPKNMKTVYTVIDTGKGKSRWMKLGIGFVNRDGSINVKLDAHPANNSLQIRDYEPPEQRRAGFFQPGEDDPTGAPTASLLD